jgi:DNA mismatch endonuclease (patch repair protein)
MKKGTLPTSSQRSELMSRVRQHGTEPELVVRSILTRIGARYRLNARSLPGSPDIANRTKKKAIFIHGCFWHYHGDCPRGRIPGSNVAYWKPKLLENRRRDKRRVADLQRNGFDVIVVWECELSHEDRLSKRLGRFWNRLVR